MGSGMKRVGSEFLAPGSDIRDQGPKFDMLLRLRIKVQVQK